MTSLHQWYLTHTAGNTSILHGIVTGHPKLPDACSIHTSVLHSITQDEQEHYKFVFQTENTDYHLTMEDCDYRRCRKFVQAFPTSGELPGYTQWAAQFEKFAQEYERDLPGCEAPIGSILLRLGCHQQYYFDSMDIHLGDGSHLPTEMSPHVGMFQDSVLCRTNRLTTQDYYDLRYFPYRDGNVEFYCWETQGLPVYIENCGNTELRVQGVEWVYLISPGEKVLIDPTNASPGVGLTSRQDLYDIWGQRNGLYADSDEMPPDQNEP